MECSLDDARDLLSDLAHDLGKYLVRPLAWLPADASAEAVRLAAVQALNETMRGPRGVRSAAQIWAEFLAEIEHTLASEPTWAALVNCVEVALAWGERLHAPVDRAAIQADFTAVGVAVRTLMGELH
jgi:hypothetical protein